MSTISVVIPVYRADKYLRRCLDSLLAQTFTDFEAILVDDGSPDNSGEICEEYSNLDSRFVAFHQQNQGQSVARNFALDWIFENSNSSFITFVDSDDWVHPQYLEALYSAIRETDANASIIPSVIGSPESPPGSGRSAVPPGGITTEKLVFHKGDKDLTSRRLLYACRYICRCSRL
jgi:glycosyltransferase involved in cell wall biosynthesis